MKFAALSGWHLHHGSWWMWQWQVDRWISLGIHLDLARRRTACGVIYGPYFDLHLGPCILSIGVNPAYSVDNTQGRGGILAKEA